MRVLITGKGTSGSWRIRGEQLGGAIGAEVFPKAEMAEVRGADLVVVVKRTPEALIRTIRTAGKRWVYDIVDAWPQPYGNAWSREQAVRWLQLHLRELAPTAVVFPTTRMWQDSCWEGPAMVLPHHAWPKYQTGPVAGCVNRVGYEGSPDYLGRWRGVMESECARRGWEFVVNGDLTTCQIGVALRDVPGYPCGAWKANTKLANLQALGLPALVSPEASYSEFGTGAEFVINTPDDVTHAINALEPVDVRVAVASVSAPPRLADVARTYQEWLWRVASS